MRFCGLDLGTRPGAVMTPRAASEALVSTAIALLGGRPAVVADVGTGSGAVAIAIAAGAPAARVWATDTSRTAVVLARENIHRHRLSDRVLVREGDLLDPVPEPVDLVVANLPYLPVVERASHPDLAAEPAEAVFAAGDGLGPYRRLLEACEEALTDSGALAIQHRRRVLVAQSAELAALRARLETKAAGRLAA